MNLKYQDGPNPEHLSMLLNEGVEAWNRWRKGISLLQPNLRSADLSNRTLDDVDFRNADLCGASLQGAHLSRANLDHALLQEANLTRATLYGANLFGALLAGASLDSSDLRDVNLSFAQLNHARLREAWLWGTNFYGAILTAADFRDANITQASFSETDLSTVIGLDQVTHGGPSSIGIETLFKSNGKIPESFLLGCGVPKHLMDELLPLVRSGLPIQWHSCFISYSGKDEEFARRLYARMQQARIQVYLAKEDLKGGEKLHEQLFRAIQLHDKLLLVLSMNSIQSEWVMTEIRKAREIERKENRRKLFPIRLCTFDELRDWTCFDADSGKDLPVEVREYYIPDFSNWRDHDVFEQEFEKLQRDLKADQKTRSTA